MAMGKKNFFSYKNLMKVAESRGYMSERSVLRGLYPFFDCTQQTLKKRLMHGRLTLDECTIIGAFFNMSPKEFCYVFFSGYFRDVGHGIFECFMDDVALHVNPVNESRKKRKEREKTLEEILQELEKM